MGTVLAVVSLADVVGRTLPQVCKVELRELGRAAATPAAARVVHRLGLVGASSRSWGTGRPGIAASSGGGRLRAAVLSVLWACEARIASPSVRRRSMPAEGRGGRCVPRAAPRPPHSATPALFTQVC